MGNFYAMEAEKEQNYYAILNVSAEVLELPEKELRETLKNNFNKLYQADYPLLIPAGNSTLKLDIKPEDRKKIHENFRERVIAFMVLSDSGLRKVYNDSSLTDDLIPYYLYNRLKVPLEIPVKISSENIPDDQVSGQPLKKTKRKKNKKQKAKSKKGDDHSSTPTQNENCNNLMPVEEITLDKCKNFFTKVPQKKINRAFIDFRGSDKEVEDAEEIYEILGNPDLRFVYDANPTKFLYERALEKQKEQEFENQKKQENEEQKTVDGAKEIETKAKKLKKSNSFRASLDILSKINPWKKNK